MPNEMVVGVWISSLTYVILNGEVLPSPLTSVDGAIEIRDSGGSLSGTHRNTGDPLQNIRFDEQLNVLQFYRRDPQDPELNIHYTGKVIDGEIIIGSFEHRSDGGPADGDTGTWGATNPGVGPLDRNRRKARDRRKA